MKECPICKARCFSDMEVCYGCMHVFAEPKEKAGLGEPERQETLTLPLLELEKGSPKQKSVKNETEIMVTQEEVSEKEIRAKHRAEPKEIKEELFQAEYQLVISLKPTNAAHAKSQS